MSKFILSFEVNYINFTIYHFLLIENYPSNHLGNNLVSLEVTGNHSVRVLYNFVSCVGRLNEIRNLKLEDIHRCHSNLTI
jgi:hypothetical protein